jgi:hypothetical protein
LRFSRLAAGADPGRGGSWGWVMRNGKKKGKKAKGKKIIGSAASAGINETFA